MKRVLCKDCRFFCPKEGSENKGECRLNPPVFVRAKDAPTWGIDFIFAWPEMKVDDWCGQGK